LQKSRIRGTPVEKQILNSNNDGFTLVELLVSLVILMVGLLGLLQAINLSISTNVRNDMRTQAASIAEAQMANQKSLPFDNMTASVEKSRVVPIALRSSFVNYSVAYSIEVISANSKRVNIGVRWHHKSNNYEHVVTTVALRPDTR
jgi:type IV pilus assembly protein PilV